MTYSLITNQDEIKIFQKALKKQLTSVLDIQKHGRFNFKGGGLDGVLYYSNDSNLCVMFDKPKNMKNTRRYWNAFGRIESSTNTQNIIVEINIPESGNNSKIAAFFARHKNGHVYLMHTGKIGGGRKGVGKKKFLKWLDTSLKTVFDDEGKNREGIIIGKMHPSKPKIVDSIWAFVEKVEKFKKTSQRQGGNLK